MLTEMKRFLPEDHLWQNQIIWYDGFQGENQNLPINHELVNKTNNYELNATSKIIKITKTST